MIRHDVAMRRQLLIGMFEHVRWADRRVLAALQQAPGGDPAALEQLAHVLGAEHVWLARLRGEAPRVAVWPPLTLDECARLVEENADGFQGWLARASEADLERSIDYVNSAGQAFASRAADILLQVALHGSYHRGMISLIVRRGGGTPAPTDYIAFVRGAAAATRPPA